MWEGSNIGSNTATHMKVACLGQQLTDSDSPLAATQQLI
jgi:hypothetical protein